GPDELNDIRWAGTLEKTREGTAKTHAAIERLIEVGRPPSLIVTLHRGNATAEKLPRLNAWLRDLDQKGVRRVRLHILESDHALIRMKYALSTEENVAAFRNFAALEKTFKHLKMDVFSDMKAMLKGRDQGVTCVWRGCDPYTTAAVQGVEGSGRMSNCGRTNKHGVDFMKAEEEGYERYIALYQVPQDHGGCQGCRFFLMCKGNCPGTAMDGDWRNRTEHCEVWKTLFEELEHDMVEAGAQPISLAPDRAKIEGLMLEYWSHGMNPPLAIVVEKIRGAP
ncbi:MAG: radical SAM protein, partial [Bacteroidota bacterium]